MAATIARADEPTELDGQEGDTFLLTTRAVLGVPLRGAGELLGFVTLGPAAGGKGYDVDDRDLLRAITHHAGVLLAHARMADDRQASAELDALNRFAAFYLHDFKNLTARLSLVAQNAAKHGDDPEFRAEAMKTVTRTAEQMGELIAQLARRSPAHGRIATVDLAELASTTLHSLGPDYGAELHVEGTLGKGGHPEQLQQVVLNLVLNAKRASSKAESKPRVQVRLTREDARVRLEVADTGPGIPPERMRTLFQPFQSGGGGFGIGLYSRRGCRVVPRTSASRERGRKGDSGRGGAASRCGSGRGRADCGSGKEKRHEAQSGLGGSARGGARGSGCGMVKDFRKNRHLKAAEKYVAEKKWKEATIEYRVALRSTRRISMP